MVIGALILDYGGGFGLKPAALALALLWTLTRAGTFSIYGRRWLDFFIPVVLPALVAMIHLFSFVRGDAGALRPFAGRLYNTISSPLLLLLFPLIYFAGALRSARYVAAGLRIVAVSVIMLFILQTAGVIDVNNASDTLSSFRVGHFGVDNRIAGDTMRSHRVIAPGAAFAIPMAFGHELARHPIGALLLSAAVLIVGARALILGIVLIFVLSTMLAFRLASTRHWRGILAFTLSATLVVVFYAPLRFRVSAIGAERSTRVIAQIRTQLLGAPAVLAPQIESVGGSQDVTTQIRIDHFRGYAKLVRQRPSVLVIGAGPLGAIHNESIAFMFGNQWTNLTETPLLNLAIYYGLLYALLYAVWLFSASFRLWRRRHEPGFSREDWGILIGVTIFWVTGNINPTLITPFSMIGYMIMVVRTDELRPATPLDRKRSTPANAGEVHVVQ